MMSVSEKTTPPMVRASPFGRVLGSIGRALAAKPPGGASSFVQAYDDDLFRLIEPMPAPPDTLTDVAFLQYASYWTLTGERWLLIQRLHVKMDELLARAQDFEKPSFSDTRFNSWVKVVYQLCGHINTSNKQFLETLGKVYDRPVTLKRALRLVRIGLDEADRRYGGSFGSPGAWAGSVIAESAAVRRHLAYALNYLGRFAFSFGFSALFTERALQMLKGRFDISNLVMNVAQIPVSNGENAFLSHVDAACTEMGGFFDLGQSGNFTSLAARFRDYTPIVNSMMLNHVRTLSNLSRYDEVNRLVADLGLTYEDLLRRNHIDPFLQAILFDRMAFRRLLVTAEAFDADKGAAVRMVALRATLLTRAGRLDEARALLRGVRDFRKTSISDFARLSRAIEFILPLEDQETFILEIKRRILRMSKTATGMGAPDFVGRSIAVTRQANELKVMKGYQQAVSRMIDMGIATSRPEDDMLAPGDRVVLFTFIQDKVSPAIIAPLMPTLRRHGAKLFSLVRDGMANELVRRWRFSPQLTPSFDALDENEDTENSTGDLLNQWTIDPDKQVISCLGVNYYQGFYERLSRVLKVFTLDWRLPHVKFYFRMWLQQADRLIGALEGARHVAAERDIRITLVSLQSQFVPGFILKFYAAANADRFSHVNISSSYENWVSNISGKPLGTLTLLNNTTHPEPSAPAFGAAKDFERWLEDEYRPNQAAYAPVLDRLLSVKRAGDATEEAEAFFGRLKALKSRGGKVFCALGKIPYDLCVPYQGGPAHRSMKDWINHTVEIANNGPHILLVKPHPHEINYNISQKPNESFVDLIERPFANNVITTPQRGVGVQSLISEVDAFLCWNGSSIAELGAQGAKIVAADDWATKNYPIRVKTPADRADYEMMLRGEAEINMHPEFEERSKAYVAYLSTAPFAIPYPYVSRSSTNSGFNNAWYNWDWFSAEKLGELINSEDRIVSAFLPSRDNELGSAPINRVPSCANV